MTQNLTNDTDTNTTDAISDATSDAKINATVDAVELRGIDKSYSTGAGAIKVLDQLTLSIPQGKTAAITGPSGSGKSTLLGILAGLDHPDSGSVWMNGVNITTMSQQDLARFRAMNLGIVFQQFHLIGTLTAIENIALPLEIMKQKHAFDTAREPLEAVGLLDRANHLPSQLSGGECQRVAIARALTVKPKILLADEPSGNLDQATGEKVMDLLFKLTAERGTTLILVTHNPELARRCDLQFSLRGGQLHLEST